MGGANVRNVGKAPRRKVLEEGVIVPELFPIFVKFYTHKLLQDEKTTAWFSGSVPSL